MRDFAKVAPQFWTGETGRQIRAMGPECQVLALYLITCPTAHAMGLYYLPMETVAHETGIPLEGVRKALRRLSEAPSKGVGSPFCDYNEETEWVFVLRMAHHQVAESLELSDNRWKWVRKELKKAMKSGLFNAFLNEYRDAYRLYDVDPLRSPFEAPSDPLRSPFEAPSDPLRSNEKETETKKETEMENEYDPAPVERAAKRKIKTSWPDDLTLTEKMKADALAIAQELKFELDCEQEFKAWKDDCLANDRRYRDWGSAWCNRIRNFPKFSGRRPQTSLFNGCASNNHSRPSTSYIEQELAKLQADPFSTAKRVNKEDL